MPRRAVSVRFTHFTAGSLGTGTPSAWRVNEKAGGPKSVNLVAFCGWRWVSNHGAHKLLPYGGRLSSKGVNVVQRIWSIFLHVFEAIFGFMKLFSAFTERRSSGLMSAITGHLIRHLIKWLPLNESPFIRQYDSAFLSGLHRSLVDQAHIIELKFK